MCYTPDRQINPDSLYEKESEETEEEDPLYCYECGDEILTEEYLNNGFPICFYCKVHVLKH